MTPRIKRLLEASEEVDVILIQNSTEPFFDYTFFWATQVTEGIFERSAVLLYPDGSSHVITSELEGGTAERSGLEHSRYKSKKERDELIQKRISGLKRIGVNGNAIVSNELRELKKWAPGAKFVDVSKAVNRARLIKDAEEIETLRKACSIASESVEEVQSYFKPGVKEYEIAAELCYLMQKKGAGGPAFDMITAFGANSAEPHYLCGDKELREGDFALLDFGALYRRYRSDITRTFVMGKASSEQRRMYEVVKEAQQMGLDGAKAGVKGGDVHNKVEEFINGTEYKGKFNHSLGHAIGLATHDAGGVLHPRVDIVLEENMVFTIEPGIYINGFGGVRIEDDILIKRDGMEVLTSASKDFIEL